MGKLIDFKRALNNDFGDVELLEEENLPGMGCLRQFLVYSARFRCQYLVDDIGKTVDPSLPFSYNVSNTYDLNNFQEAVIKLSVLTDEKVIEKVLQFAESVIHD